MEIKEQKKYRQKPTIRQKAFEMKLKEALVDPEGFTEKHGKPTLRNIAKKVGYSDEVADNTHRIRRNQSFAMTVEEEVNILNKLIADAYEVLEREKDNARYQDATQGIERLMKQKQLLTGQATENIAFKIIE